MLVTTPVNAARVKLGAQVVQVLVKQGFTGPKKWESVILPKQARLPGATDLTQYGKGRASTKAVLTHHVANISTVVQASGGRRPHRAQRHHLARKASVTRLRLKCLGLVWAVRVS